jgi:hypothetical protein
LDGLNAANRRQHDVGGLRAREPATANQRVPSEELEGVRDGAEENGASASTRLPARRRVRPFPIDVMVYAVVAMNSLHAEKPFVSLLGETLRTDPSGFARMLSEILLDGLVIDREG